MTYITRPIKWIVQPVSEPIFSNQATTVEITDEAAGEFVTVQQQSDAPNGRAITIDREIWPQLRDAIEHALSLCEDHE